MGHRAGSEEEEPHQKGGKESHGVRKLGTNSPSFAIDEILPVCGIGIPWGLSLMPPNSMSREPV